LSLHDALPIWTNRNARCPTGASEAGGVPGRGATAGRAWPAGGVPRPDPAVAAGGPALLRLLVPERATREQLVTGVAPGLQNQWGTERPSLVGSIPTCSRKAWRAI